MLQIFKHLRPSDILQLARVNKTFRSFLMVRSAKPIWRAARVNVPGMPDCPAHLSEPAYAHLAFDSHCHVRIQFHKPIPGDSWLAGVLETQHQDRVLGVRCSLLSFLSE